MEPRGALLLPSARQATPIIANGSHIWLGGSALGCPHAKAGYERDASSELSLCIRDDLLGHHALCFACRCCTATGEAKHSERDDQLRPSAQADCFKPRRPRFHGPALSNVYS